MIENPNIWIGDLINNEKCEKVFQDWKRKKQALAYIFSTDLKKMKDDFDSNLVVIDGQHPHLLKLFNSKNITIETLIIIDKLTKVFSYWDKKIVDNLVWPDINKRCRKYSPFIEFDRDKFKKILIDKYS
jgi:hypothetical protein